MSDVWKFLELATENVGKAKNPGPQLRMLLTRVPWGWARENDLFYYRKTSNVFSEKAGSRWLINMVAGAGSYPMPGASRQLYQGMRKPSSQLMTEPVVSILDFNVW